MKPSLLSCSENVYTSDHLLDHYQSEQDLTNKFEMLTDTRNSDTAKEWIHNDGHHDRDLKNVIVPLLNGFAHNDYLHKIPLFDALDNGFTNIEADIFLINGKLIVAHIFPFFKSHRTLEALYLQPLFERITKNKGRVFENYNGPVTLLIDIKTNADNTYIALKPLLEKYRSMLTGYEDGKVIYRAVTIVLSGNKPCKIIENEQSRLVFNDEDLLRLPLYSAKNNVFIMASCKYSRLLRWDGDGVIPSRERNRLCALISMAHKMGAKVRLWASPEKEIVWDELLSCGVDLICTGELVALKNYLKRHNWRGPIDIQNTDIELSRAFADVVLPDKTYNV